MRPLILLPFLALACAPTESIEAQISYVEFARTYDDGFHVSATFYTEDCVDPASFASSTLGDLEASYLTDEDVMFPGLSFLATDPPTTFLNGEACDGVVNFGFNDASSFLDEDQVLLQMTGDAETLTFTLDSRTFADWELTPTSDLALETFWSSTVVQTMQGIHPIDPGVTVFVQYASGREELPATAYTVDDTTLTVTLPDANPRPDMGDPVFLVFQDVLPAFEPGIYDGTVADIESDVFFTFENNTNVIASRSVTPAR